MSITPTDEQLAAIDMFSTGADLAIQAGAGTGKALRVDQPVLTPDGWTAIGDLKVGDEVIGSDGQPYPVLGVYAQGIREMFEVVCSDGTVVVADGEHLWATTTTKDRDRKRPAKVRTTAEIAASVRIGKNGRVNHYLPMMSAPAELAEKSLPLDPYLIGVLLGDACLTDGTAVLSTPDHEILEMVGASLPIGVAAVYNGQYDWRLTASGMTKPGHRGFFNPLTEMLRDLGMVGCKAEGKFVPHDYLYGSAAQRLALLQGLLDTDGSAAACAVEFGTASKQLAADVTWLAQSLGGVVHGAEREPWFTYRGERRNGQTCYRLRVSLPSSIAPFRLTRKAAALKPRTRFEPYRQIREVRPANAAEAVCISLGSPDQLFITEGCIPTHNTSVLLMIAEAARQTGRMGQYSAFNRAIVLDTARKMPSNVACNTMHSLTIQGLDPRLRQRLSGSRRLSPQERSRLTGINFPIRVQYGADTKILQPAKLSGIAMRAITNFCQSADKEIESYHFPYIEGIDMPTDGKKSYANNDRVRRELLPIVRKLWPKLTDPDGELPFKHEIYLKMAQVNGVRFPVDFILFDEAQDVSPVMESIISSQRQYGTQLCFVGDQAQSIYGWMGSVDAMASLPVDQTAWLTQSFRFGESVAGVANLILRELQAELVIKGLPSIPSMVGPVDSPTAVLTRTNSAAVSRVLREITAGNRPHLVGGGAEIVSFAKASIDLMENGWTSHFDLSCFTSWMQVCDYVDQDAEGSDLKLNVDLVNEYGAQVILDALDGGLAPENHASLIVSTAHRGKGREWSSVQLAGDFPKSLKGERPVSDEELRLLYVACTRAQHQLDVSNCGVIQELTNAMPVLA